MMNVSATAAVLLPSSSSSSSTSSLTSGDDNTTLTSTNEWLSTTITNYSDQSTAAYTSIQATQPVTESSYRQTYAYAIIPQNTTAFLVSNLNNVTLSDDSKGSCSDWQELQHALFQLANLCLIVSFLTPSSFQHHVFFLRFILGFGYLFFTLWAGFFVCMPDVLGWNSVFFCVNLVHMVYLGYKMFPARFRSELEELYSKVFKPLKISRQQFKDLSSLADLYVLSRGSVYAREEYTDCGEKVSMLVKGRLKVMYQQLFLHFIEVDQFVDSPEYDSIHSINMNNTDLKYQVTIVAADDSLLLTWQISQLKHYLNTDIFLASVFHLITGKDISTKLYQIQELLLTNPNYMQTSSSRQSSIVNLRSAIVSNSSDPNLNKLNCFGINLKGWSSSSSHVGVTHYPMETYESRV